ncbi:hypothetical protein [Streptomyces sp. NPDC056683]|uniref:hypothetical protein n=1 Tax=Streptomyces sp. NPDC056683 TaxID=3345910 RepID=UPI00368A1BC7
MDGTPYVTAAEFTAHPTYLDLETLRPGIMDPAAQTAELTSVLLASSGWADNVCNQTLGAHRVDLSTHGRIDRDGNLVVFPSDRPVLSVAAVSYGSTFTRMSYLPAPAFRVDSNQTILIPVGRVPIRGRVWVDITYTAGWVSTLLAANATAGATSLTVADPTGIMPGATYRLWEPGVEETVRVSPTWTPPAATTAPAPTAVPLAAPTVNAHTAGSGWSGMPADMRLAVVNYTIGQLMRPDNAAEDSFPDTSLSAGTRQEDSRKDGSGLVTEAERILGSYTRRM